MSRSKRNQHGLKATIGIIAGLLLAAVGAVAVYFNYAPGKGTKWALLLLPALPLTAWGSYHLGRQRGYPGGAGCGLFMFALFVSGLIAGVHTPVTVGFSFVFVGIMPVAVLLALPRKSRHSRHH